MEKEIYLLDDPLSAVDPDVGDEMFQKGVLGNINENRGKFGCWTFGSESIYTMQLLVFFVYCCQVGQTETFFFVLETLVNNSPFLGGVHDPNKFNFSFNYRYSVPCILNKTTVSRFCSVELNYCSNQKIFMQNIRLIHEFLSPQNIWPIPGDRPNFWIFFFFFFPKFLRYSFFLEKKLFWIKI